jgi:rhodanese-related sulfurtransferase
MVVFIYFNIIFKKGVHAQAYMAKDLSAKEAEAQIRARKPVILDIRTPGEFRSGHIQEAINIDFYNGFTSSISKLDKSKPYFIYCRSGSRSSAALGIMESMGFTSLLHLEYGILDWEEAGLPLTKT